MEIGGSSGLIAPGGSTGSFHGVGSGRFIFSLLGAGAALAWRLSFFLCIPGGLLESFVRLLVQLSRVLFGLALGFRFEFLGLPLGFRLRLLLQFLGVLFGLRLRFPFQLLGVSLRLFLGLLLQCPRVLVGFQPGRSFELFGLPLGFQLSFLLQFAGLLFRFNLGFLFQVLGGLL